MTNHHEQLATKQVLLEAATTVFLTKGFDNATIREICRKANRTTGAFYQHFQSKNELLKIILSPLFTALTNSYKQQLQQGLAAINKVKIGQIWQEYLLNLDPLITIIYAHPQKRALLLFDAAGSQYSDLAELTTRYFTQQFIELINVMQQQHVIPFEFQFNYQELHFRVFAFFATVCDILKHNYQEAETKALCRGLYQFFYPGWLTWLQIKQPG